MADMGGNVILAPLAARNPMVEDLDGNGYAILDLSKVETDALLGTISESEIQKLDGAGLFVDENGELRVDSSVYDGTIDGLSNPLTADLDAAGYNIDNAGSVNAGDLSRGNGNLINQGSTWAITEALVEGPTSDTSSSSFTKIADVNGAIVRDDIPDGAAVYGRFLYSLVDDSNETATVVPEIRLLPQRNSAQLSELEVSSDGSGSLQTLDSGWTEITTTTVDIANVTEILGKTTGGTLTSRPSSDHALIFKWRVE